MSTVSQNTATKSEGDASAVFASDPVKIADKPKVIEQQKGYGDWIPVVEMRRVLEDGKTVRLELAIRGEEAKAHRIVRASDGGVTIHLTLKDWDLVSNAVVP